MRDKDGKIAETFEGMCDRVSARLARFTVDPTQKTDAQPKVIANLASDYTYWANEYYRMQYNQEFLANLPVYFNIGNKIEMGSACFILPVGDSIREIYQAVREGAIIGKLGGGIGMDFSDLRTTGTITSSGGVSSGALSFMTAFQTMNRTIAQGGRRRGAMMGQMSVHHPEILHFIDCKRETKPALVKKLMDDYKFGKEGAEEVLHFTDWVAPYSEFNLTVKITDKFWQAVENDHQYEVHNSEWTTGTYRVTDPRGSLNAKFAGRQGKDGVEIYSLPAKEVWERIVESAWASGEPGVAFIDRINQDNPVPQMGKIATSNPCGEYWQVPYSSCILGSINLSKFVKEGWGAFTKTENPVVNRIDWGRLKGTVIAAIYYLNAVIDINEYPIPEIKKVTLDSRPVGLGVMGWADLLLMLGIRYGSKDSLDLAERVMLFIDYWAWYTSTELAAKYGAYPQYNTASYDSSSFFCEKLNKLEYDYANTNFDYDPKEGLYNRAVRYGVRNCQVTTIAPTGTISLLAECSSGIEPVFAYEMKRQDTVGTREYVHWFKEAWDDNSRKDIVAGLEAKFWPDYAVAAHEVTPEEHVRMQAAFQKYCDNGVSKTVNLAHAATIEDVRQVYELAHELGCKSVTVYRDGCREGVLLKKEAKVEPAASKIEELPQIVEAPAEKVEANGYIHRADLLPGATWKINTPHGTVYVTVNYDPDLKCILEVFIRENSGNEAWELTGRLLSLLLRSRIPIQKIQKQLNRTLGQSTIVLRGNILTSIAQAIAQVLEMAQEYFTQAVVPTETAATAEPKPPIEEYTGPPVGEELDKICPQCGRYTLVRAEGCVRCLVCPYNKCGGG
jgi:ribonucleoside-diphosphate reductase alpha chain